MALLLSALPAAAAGSLAEPLRQRLDAMLLANEAVAAGRPLLATAPLVRLYETRLGQPIWFDGQAQPTPIMDQLLPAIDRAWDHGLDPEHYHREALAELLAQRAEQGEAVDRRLLVDIELLASDGLLSLGHHLLNGRVDPESIDPGWLIEREPPDLFAELAASRGDGAPVDLRQILDRLAPRYPAYQALVQRLALHRSLSTNGAWPTIADGPLLRPGDSDQRVEAIRRRLRQLGDFGEADSRQSADNPASAEDRYDETLQIAVRAFQRRHGLEADAVIGPRTLAELNTTPPQRAAQLRANMERWRWLPRALGEEYILVNIAGFNLQVHYQGEIVMTQRVVVGTPFRRTPVFTGRMSYLVLNPSWEVPPRLAAQDQLPRIRADLSYLDRMGFSVLQGWGADERRIDPTTIDWRALSARNFPYRLRQAPGPDNALGRVKFMFPNRHNVYLHDTPARALFGREERAFSSGCIRVDNAEALARWLLTERSSLVSAARIDSILASGQETTLRLDRPLPVHLLYWTAWVDEQGQVQYRRDIYERDGRLIEALDAPPQSP